MNDERLTKTSRPIQGRIVKWREQGKRKSKVEGWSERWFERLIEAWIIIMFLSIFIIFMLKWSAIDWYIYFITHDWISNIAHLDVVIVYY